MRIDFHIEDHDYEVSKTPWYLRPVESTYTNLIPHQVVLKGISFRYKKKTIKCNYILSFKYKSVVNMIINYACY